MASRTIKITIKLPKGVVATDELVKAATKAATASVESLTGDLAKAQKAALELAKQGFKVSAEDLLKSKSGTRSSRTAKPTSKKAARKRILLSDAQKAALAEDLKKGLKINEAALKYGVSSATVMNVKKAAGLTKKTPKA